MYRFEILPSLRKPTATRYKRLRPFFRALVGRSISRSGPKLKLYLCKVRNVKQCTRKRISEDQGFGRASISFKPYSRSINHTVLFYARLEEKIMGAGQGPSRPSWKRPFSSCKLLCRALRYRKMGRGREREKKERKLEKKR